MIRRFADNEWSVLDASSPNTRILIERNGELIDAAEWQRYKSFCNDLSRAGSTAAIRLLRAVLGVPEGDRYLYSDEEAADHFIADPDLALKIEISFLLRAGWLDRLELDVSEWLDYEKRSEYRQHADRGQDAIERIRKVLRLAHRGRRGKGRVHPDDRDG